jgi:hypothetical protein
VFLNAEGRCVLQKASIGARLAVSLKPYFCTAFPVTIDRGVVTLDDKDFRAGQPCCDTTERGPLTVLDTCVMELRHVLGAPGVSALRRAARRRPGLPTA